MREAACRSASSGRSAARAGGSATSSMRSASGSIGSGRGVGKDASIDRPLAWHGIGFCPEMAWTGFTRRRGPGRIGF